MHHQYFQDDTLPSKTPRIGIPVSQDSKEESIAEKEIKSDEEIIESADDLIPTTAEHRQLELK